MDFRREDVFSEENADTHILVLPAGHDPDSFIFEHGPQAFLTAASNSPGIVTFLMDCAIRKHGLSTEGKLRIISELQHPLAAINDRIAQSIYIQQLAERIGIAESAVMGRVREIETPKYGGARTGGTAAEIGADSSKNAGPEYAPRGGGRAGGVAGSRFERRIIAMMLQFPEILPDIAAHNVLEFFENSDLRSIGEFILEVNPTASEQVSELISQIETREKQALIASLAMENESWNKKGCLTLLGKFVETRKKQRDSGLLEEQIKAAEDSNDQALLLSLLAKKQKMAERSEKQKMAILNEK